MHYYKKNIGDYAKKAGRLTMIQHGAYTLLMDSCYDREKFPTMAQAIDWTWSSSKEEIEAVEFVLSKFFTLRDGVYFQSHIEDDIATYHKNAKTNKRIAIDRETKRAQSRTKRAQTVNEAPPNHKPVTSNHKPGTSKREKCIQPTLEEVQIYFQELGSITCLDDGERFKDHFDSNGWKVGGKTAMKDWKASVRCWHKRDKDKQDETNKHRGLTSGPTVTLRNSDF